MSIGNISNPVSPNAPTTPSADKLNEMVQHGLAVAQEEQARSLLANEQLSDLSKSVKKTSQLTALEPPKASAYSGDFFDTMIIALTELAGLLGDMADSTLVELQFKREEIKRLLEDKLESIEEKEKRRLERIEAEKRIEEQQRRQGIFGSIMNFVFAAAEIVAGACMVVGGVLSMNPALIAGGACLVAAGALEVAAEVMTLTGGDEEKIDKMKKAAMGLMIAGIIIGTMGAASAAAPAAAGAKQGAKVAVKEGAERAIKEGAEKALKEGSEQATKEAAEKLARKKIAVKTAEIAAKNFSKGAIVQNVGNQSYRLYMATQQQKYDIRQAELEHEIAQLKAQLDATLEKQELVNKLIQLLQEHWTRAVAGPIEDALKVLNDAIKDRGQASQRIAASFSV